MTYDAIISSRHRGTAYRARLNQRSLLLRVVAPSPGYYMVLHTMMVRDFLRRASDGRHWGLDLDWDIPQGVEGEALFAGMTPCGFANVGKSNSYEAGDRYRFTMFGRVVDYAKRNNMGYALVASQMGFTDTEILYGPDMYLRLERREIPFVGTSDNEYAKESYRAGIDLSNGQSLNAVIANRGLNMLVPGMRAEKEWPSYETTSAGLQFKQEAANVMEALIQ